MNALAQRMVLCWMLASGAHLPLPVCDSDGRTGGRCAAGAAGSQGPNGSKRAVTGVVDLDYILLGCQTPEDADDGPVDYDPEPGDGSPTFLSTRTLTGPLGDLGAAPLIHGGGRLLAREQPRARLVLRCVDGESSCVRLNLGTAVPMRC